MKKLLVAAALLSLGAASVQAATSYTALTPVETIGLQGFGGAMGMDFDVSSSILVTQLGAFDSAQDGLNSTITVGIIDRGTGQVVGSFATLSGTAQVLIGTSRFADVADFTLGVGHYSVVAYGYSAAEKNGNRGFGGTASSVDNGGGLLSFSGTSRWTNTAALVLPTVIDGGPANRYDAGTFQFQAAAVPEPETYALMLAGLGALGFMGRRRKRGGQA